MPSGLDLLLQSNSEQPKSGVDLLSQPIDKPKSGLELLQVSPSTAAPIEIPIESIEKLKPAVGPQQLYKEHTQKLTKFFSDNATTNFGIGVNNKPIEDQGFKDKVGKVVGETLQGLSDLVTNPIEGIKGGLDIVLSMPGFLVGLVDASSNVVKESIDQIVLGQTFNLEEIYNKAAEGMERSMKFFEPGKELVLGKMTPERDLASQVIMAPIGTLSMAGHKVANWEGFKDYPNIRGAARFAGDISGFLAMGMILHGPSRRAKFTKDIEDVVKGSEEIIAKEQAIEGIPNELIKQTQMKILEIQKKQMELKAEEISKEFAKDVLVREELAHQAEVIAKEKMRPVEDTKLTAFDTAKPRPLDLVGPRDLDIKLSAIDKAKVSALDSAQKSALETAKPGLIKSAEANDVVIVKRENGKIVDISIVKDTSQTPTDKKEVEKPEMVKKFNDLDKVKEGIKEPFEGTVFRGYAEGYEFRGDGSPMFFSPLENSVKGYARMSKHLGKPTVSEYNVKLNNPKVYDGPLEKGKSTFATGSEQVKELKAQGYDGAIYKENGIVKDVIAFDKDQVNRIEPITELDQATGTSIPNIEGTQSPFFQDLAKTTEFKDIYLERQKSLTENVEMFTQKLINDVNQWYHKVDNIPIERVRSTLSDLASRADELRGEFITGQDHLIWKETVSEAASWARRLERGEVETVRKFTKEERLAKIKEVYEKLHEDNKPKVILRKKGGGTKLTSGVDPTEGIKAIIDGAKAVSRYAKEARGFKKFRPKEAIKMVKEEFGRAFVDRSGNIRNILLEDLGQEGYEAVQKMYLAKGASALSSSMLKQMGKEVYGGLSKVEKNILDNVILSDRISDIAKYKSVKQFKYPKGLEPVNVVAYSELFGQIEGLTPRRSAEIRKRAAAYFEWMKKPLEDMLRAELITNEEYVNLVSHNYRRLKLVDVFDKKQKLGRHGRTVYDSGVEALSRGRDTDVFEPSSEIMALEVFNRAYGRILNNQANKALLDVATSDPQNPFVRVKTKESDPIPSGWHRSFVYEKGERKAIYLSPEMNKEWITSNPETSYRYSQLMRYASGSPVLRTFATGINWSFAVANLPRDVMHTWFAARTWKDGEWSSVYSPTMPVFFGQIGRDQATIFNDALSRRGRYQEYINEGGGMEFLVHQGRLFQRGRHIEGPIDSVYNVLGYLGELSEIMTRLAIRERVIRNRAKEQGLTMEQARKNKSITQEATFAARDYMDFGQGGGIAKALDNAVPYLNASIQGTRGLFRSFKPGSGTAFSSTYKLAQFAVLISGLTIAARSMHPETMKNMEGSKDAQNNLIIPLGDKFGFEDSKGQVRYPYLKIPLDPGQKFFKTFFEASTDKWLGNDIDVNRVVDSLKETSPAGVTSLPPTVSGTIGYWANKDFWLNEDIWRKTDKPFSFPHSKEEYIPGQTPQAFIDLGKVTGLSPERTRYAVEELLTSGTVYSYLLGQGYDAMFSQMPKDQREKHLAEVLSKVPIVKRFFGITNPYSKFATGIERAEEEATIERFKENRQLDTLAEGYLFKDNVKREEVFDYISKAKDRDAADRLRERFKFQEATLNLPERSFWLRLQGVPVEARAKVFVDRLDKSSPEQQEQIWKEYAIMSRAGGVISKSFRREVSLLRGRE